MQKYFTIADVTHELRKIADENPIKREKVEVEVKKEKNSDGDHDDKNGGLKMEDEPEVIDVKFCHGNGSVSEEDDSRDSQITDTGNFTFWIYSNNYD